MHKTLRTSPSSCHYTFAQNAGYFYLCLSLYFCAKRCVLLPILFTILLNKTLGTSTFLVTKRCVLLPVFVSILLHKTLCTSTYSCLYTFAQNAAYFSQFLSLYFCTKRCVLLPILVSILLYKTLCTSPSSWLGQYSFQVSMIVIATRFFLSLRYPLFRQCLSGKAASGLERMLLKELQESMDRCTGRRDISEILLKTALNTIKSMSHFLSQYFCTRRSELLPVLVTLLFHKKLCTFPCS